MKNDDNYFAAYNQRFKPVCKKKTCTGCTSMFYVNKAHRWCYDEKYNLKSDQAERVRVNNVSSNVMTGIIESDDLGDFSGMYEKNLRHYSGFLSDDRMIKGIQKVADNFGIQANSLTACLIKELR